MASDIPWEIVSESKPLRGSEKDETLAKAISFASHILPEHEKIPLLRMIAEDDSCEAKCRCFRLLTLKSSVALPSQYQGNVECGLTYILLSNVAKYINEINAIWAVHTEISFTPTGSLCSADPSCHLLVPVQVKVLVIRPSHGAILTGKVQHADRTGLTAIVHGAVTAVIPKKGLNPKWSLNRTGEYTWQDNEEKKITTDSIIKIQMTGMKSRCGNALLVLEGDLIMDDDAAQEADAE